MGAWKVFQTQRGEGGNCFAACCKSILSAQGVDSPPLEDWPIYYQGAEPTVSSFLTKLGYSLVSFTPIESERRSFELDANGAASLPLVLWSSAAVLGDGVADRLLYVANFSTASDWCHSVVIDGRGRLVHDPSGCSPELTARGLGPLEDLMALVPLARSQRKVIGA